MAATSVWRTAFGSEFEAEAAFARPELAELRRTATRLLSWSLVIAALSLMFALEAVPSAAVLPLWAAIGALMVNGILALTVERWSAVPVGALLVGGLLATCLGLVAYAGSPLPLYALPLVVLVAGTTRGPAAGTATAGLAGLGVLLLPLGDWQIEAMPHRLAPIGLTAGAAVLLWLGSRPERLALAWAWGSYARALDLTEQLRAEQARLASALKSLNHTCYQLEQANIELARARTAADEARRLKVEFAANISHELRTPLNLIIGFSELLLSGPDTYDGPLVKPYVRDVEAIYRNARHLSQLIDDVLELGEVESGRMGLRKGWTNLGEVVAEAIEVVAVLFEEKGLEITRELPTDLPPVYVDRTRMRQVLINLLNNASRFTDQGGVRIAAAQDERDLTVSVADTGIGIRATDLPHVFEEFRQLEPAHARRAGGSGLGLAICKRFVELHAGNIAVSSTPGRGTTFWFSLPLTGNVASVPPKAPWETWAKPRPGGPAAEPTIVVASEDPAAVRLFQRHLDGYQVVAAQVPSAAPDGPAARALIRVVDDAGDLDAALCASTSGDVDAPVLVCRMPSERDLREELGVADYLIKPFTRERLLTSIARFPSARTILVVDDEPGMVELIARILADVDSGYRVLAADGGEMALETLRSSGEQIDLLILDLLMPPPDGREVLAALRADSRLADLPVIVVSACGFIEQGLKSNLLAVTRERGLSIQDLVACTRVLVQTLNPEPSTDR
ncbi:MAG TPA: hybrid sensor histidine kinase/response regulator [Chloroflexota bacterium]